MQAACEGQALVTKRDLVERGLGIRQFSWREGQGEEPEPRPWCCEKHSAVRAPQEQAGSEVDCEVMSLSEASRNPAGLGTPGRVTQTWGMLGHLKVGSAYGRGQSGLSWLGQGHLRETPLLLPTLHLSSPQVTGIDPNVLDE